MNYITQKLTGYNKLIALPKIKPSLVKTCHEYGLLSTIYTQDRNEISNISEIYDSLNIFKRITKGNLFFIKFYTAPAEILYDEVKSPIQVVKIGMTRDMIILEDIIPKSEIPRIEIPNFYANKRIIGLPTILQELANTYRNRNSI